MSPEDDKDSPEREFASNTSLHGLNRVAIAPSSSFRVLWALAILGSYAGFGYMFGSMIHTYFTYDTITDTKLEFVHELTFPAITICNMNKFDSSKLKVVEWSYLSRFLYGINLDIPTMLANGVPADETVNSTFANMTVEGVLIEKGFDVSPSRMHLCGWKGSGCSYMNFTHSFSYYGNCYTFNAAPVNPLKQTMEGAGNGLTALVDIKEDEYTESLLAGGISEIGLKLLVHDQKEPPMMDTQGIALAPGNHAFIAIKQAKYENHIPPWGVCQDLQLEYYDTYTLNACYLECRSKHVVRNCSCRPYNLPGTAPSCDPDTMFSCARDILVRVIRGELTCNCPVPCSMTTYSTSVSYAGWPNKHTRDYLGPALGMDKDYMAQNGVVFSVYYEKLTYQNIRELKATDEGQLACNIGGMMGLFLGASLLTLLEVCEYLLLRLSAILGKHRQHPVTVVKPITKPDDPKGGTTFHK